MRSEDEIAFVIDHYRLPIAASARRLILDRARRAEERRVRSVAGQGACRDQFVVDRKELPQASGNGTSQFKVGAMPASVSPEVPARASTDANYCNRQHRD